MVRARERPTWAWRPYSWQVQIFVRGEVIRARAQIVETLIEYGWPPKWARSGAHRAVRLL